MFWTTRLIVPAVLAAGVAVSAGEWTQPPEGEQPGEKKSAPLEKKRGFEKKGFGPGFGRGDDAKPPFGGPRGEFKQRGEGRNRGTDTSVDAWLRILAERITDPHDTIRDSARAGLVAAGQRAVPMLERIAQGDDDARATAARKVMEEIARQNRRPVGFGGTASFGSGGGGTGGTVRGREPEARNETPMPRPKDGASRVGGFTRDSSLRESPERAFTFLARGEETIDFSKMDDNQKRFAKALFERLGLPSPGDNTVITKEKFLDDVKRAGKR